MPYDERLAARLRDLLSMRRDVVEKKMFGGVCFMVAGAMCCGVLKSDLVVKIAKEQNDDALARPHARQFDFSGRPMPGMIYVAPAGTKTPAQLRSWVQRALDRIAAEGGKTKSKAQPKKRAAAKNRTADS